MADDNNVQTVGSDKNKKDEQKKEQGNNVQQKAEKTKKSIKVVKFLLTHFEITGPILLGIVIILAIIGIVSFFTSMPGMYIENIKEFGRNLWAGVVGYFTGDNITDSISEEEQIALAQRIQDMGYDVVGCGFADVKYEYDEGTTDVDGEEIPTEDIDGTTNRKIVGINQNIDGRNYLQAYIAESESIYALSCWSMAGNFKSLWSGITYAGVSIWNTVSSMFGNDDLTDTVYKDAKAYSSGMLNITIDKSLGQRIAGWVLGAKVDDLIDSIIVQIDRDNKVMKINSKDGIFSKNVYYFNMEDWSLRYGKPIELMLSLHLGTMMPDLAYDLVTEDAFNTKVNIDLQEVNATFKVIYETDGTENTAIQQNEIEKIYMKAFYGMTDTEINRFESADKLDEAFKELYDRRNDKYPSYRFNINEGDKVVIKGSYDKLQGIDLAEVENKVLGQKYSNINVHVEEWVENVYYAEGIRMGRCF